MNKPYAVYIGHQEDINGRPPIAIYNIIGGPKHGSTVSDKTLKNEGIKIKQRKNENQV